MEIEQIQHTPHKSCCHPQVGRGCCFCETDEGFTAEAAEGCFKLHEANWLDDYPEVRPCDIFEVRFKNTRRGFYQNVNNLDLKHGDIVAVEAAPGHDIGVISLTGELALKQMRRTGFNPPNGEFRKIYRKAKPYDIERWQEAIALEHETMIAARQIAADMGLNMKIGDVEYQGDKIKAIFYYIADERVDFRELIKVFAERFHIRIEMKQIGARQEAGRIGGLGACGRELCCASWMSTFTSVTTGAARTQDLSLNPQKLAGQCSKLKCCMMYEYDAYADARKDIPRLREPLQTTEGEWYLVKTDILGGLMTFSSSKETMSNLQTLPVWRVKEVLAMNRAGKRPEQLQDADAVVGSVEEPTYRAEEDSITRFDKAKRRNRNKNRNKNREKGAVAAKQSREERPMKGDATEKPTEPAAEKVAAVAPERHPAEEAQQPRTEGGEKQPRNHRNDRQRVHRQPRKPRPNGEEGQTAAPQSDSGASHAEGEQREPRNRNNRNRRFNRRPSGGEQHGEGGGGNHNAE